VTLFYVILYYRKHTTRKHTQQQQQQQQQQQTRAPRERERERGWGERETDKVTIAKSQLSGITD